MFARSATRSIVPALRKSIAPNPTPSSSTSVVRSFRSNISASSSARSVHFQVQKVAKRAFQTSAVVKHGDIERPAPGTGIKITFQDSKGQTVTQVEGNEGDDLLSLAHEWDVDLEGACEGSIACSTCHVILDAESYDKLEEPEDDENDMLDLAFGLSDTSRLGCQVKLTKDIDGMVATLPSATRNMYVDGHKPTPH
ncbi:hypothetical protein FFLO_01536 [Filobasidium floriforme]|uniref:2Fe-2S ferredoxin-type domain-containing protein n=1 Tax=Filobasidium floriforme TaxID=5210 RepID=A0A8K0JQU2_9TREE|nr:putative YAH1-ferredoxin of the mitochondrial matrix [Filobasidium floriforme]KAG7562978.1 hypothetical protein FFLO_01536 [Filobasidium floriforme]KAH8079287.1 putative YAH1-ferredoxin of the mitochondrial matrix [Filobasidium floriforme]